MLKGPNGASHVELGKQADCEKSSGQHGIAREELYAKLNEHYATVLFGTVEKP